MKLSAVIICVDYSDFLAHTLPLNRSQFDSIVVVTSTADVYTQQLCTHYRVRCVQTDVFFKNNVGPRGFNKGAGINEGLAVIDQSDWLVHMDADIVLPFRTRDILESLPLDPRCIYGVDRMMCKSHEDWMRFIVNPELQHTDDIYVTANAFPLGSRIARLRGHPPNDLGYVPIGFFQLWHPGQSGIHVYPDQHTNAGRSDMLFACQWGRPRRHLIPEIVAIHLESGENEQGANWNGRKSSCFGPTPGSVRVPFKGGYDGDC